MTPAYLLIIISMEDKILPVLLQRLNINEESVAVALEECRATFKEVSDLLEKNEGRYLLGTEKLTAADISFASLAYPLVFPPQYVLSVRVFFTHLYAPILDLLLNGIIDLPLLYNY